MVSPFYYHVEHAYPANGVFAKLQQVTAKHLVDKEFEFF